MHYWKTNLWLLLMTMIVLSSCRQNTGNKEVPSAYQPAPKEELREALIHQNKQLIREEMELIDAYTERNGLDLDTTSTGLRIKIIEKTNGRPARLMNDVTISYKAELLDGKFCYSSDSSGVLSFTLGQSTQPSGLQEGLLKMKEGERAIMIVPSFLAYGITGDAICIPGSSSIVYQLKLEKVSAL